MNTRISDFFSTFRISSVGLTAEKKQLAVTAENIANANTTRTLAGTPYKRKEVVREMISPRRHFASELRNATLRLQTSHRAHFDNSRFTPLGVNKTGSVEIKSSVEELNAFKRIYDPSHPDADETGYVEYPEINVVSEMLTLISASRSYEANITVMNATKNLARRSLDI
ncbi:MAG: flagellar basal body rod protein FlgC [bacterium]